MLKITSHPPPSHHPPTHTHTHPPLTVMTTSQTHMMTVISLEVKMRQIKSSLSFKPSKIRSKHDDSLFSENTGKLKTGLSCHHSFNNDKRYYVTSSIEKDVDRLIEDLDKAFAKYRGAYHIGSKSKTSEARKRKEQKMKEQEIERFK